MTNIKGELFKQKCDAIVITTNGFIKRNGASVMGKGCALQAKNMIAGLDMDLGKAIHKKGNNVNVLRNKKGKIALVSFPVKPISLPYDKNKIVKHMRNKITSGQIPGWACIADIKIIKRSAIQLVELANQMQWNKIVLPRPGCGAGELSYDDVEQVLQNILDDRFYIITF